MRFTLLRQRRPALVVLLAAVSLLFASVTPVHAAQADPRWVFYSKDRTHYTSPWFTGAHRIMVPYGCTPAPYYSPDPRCGGGHGFHHGIDIAMPCGTPLIAGRFGRVVSNAGYGSAYGAQPLVIRNRKLGVDILLAHADTISVQVGQRVAKGEQLALASDSAAPDGCHLHFEVRSIDGGLSAARFPRPLLKLTAG